MREAVYYKGKVVGHQRVYSDRMLEIMLKAKKPEEFREKVEVEDQRRGGDDVGKQKIETLSEELLLTIAGSGRVTSGSRKRDIAKEKRKAQSSRVRAVNRRSRKTTRG